MEDTVSRYNRGKAVDESTDKEKPELNPKPIDINTLKEEYLRLRSAYMRLNGKELEGVSFKELQQLEHQLNEGMLSVRQHKVP
ncbi:protein MIZU-KUSSEI 1-like [Hibiscus syriacus]|uniref:Protein MIZU-KUSSEI 1-like n=1 Tax=Hibiscus syriacus TaxID=106335 RepID=A0A6A2WMB2_HIBSY|nr:protein MIZU-KUSSEI 1-like [Hibiscus syriacus]